MTDTAPTLSLPPVQKPDYTGKASGFYLIYIKMFFLMLVTLGIYRYWGRTNMRRYVWSHIKIDGEPFAYLGSGMELFKSVCKFLFLIFVPSFAASLIFEFALHAQGSWPEIAFKFALGAFLFVFFYAAKFMGLRYRMGRTSWRGIRFELRGRVRDYLKLRLKNFFLNLVTFGLYCPIGDVEVLRFVINKCHFGTLAFRYRGQKEELQKTYYLCWLLLIPSLGLSIMWYRAKYIAHVAKYTNLGAVQFRMKFTGWEYLRFHLANFFLVLCTLGLAYPYVVHRVIRIYREHLQFRGMIDEATIAQAQKSQGGEGAELALGFDDFGF